MIARMRFVLALFALAACSDDPPPASPDAAPQPDAPPSNCLVEPSYTLGAITGEANTAMGGAITGTFTINPGPPRDTFFVKLTNITPGDYVIDGTDTDFNACTLCVNIIADIVAGQGPTKFYQAQSGSITLTATTATSVAGTASNIVLREVSVSTGAIVGDCATTIVSADFTGT